MQILMPIPDETSEHSWQITKKKLPMPKETTKSFSTIPKETDNKKLTTKGNHEQPKGNLLLYVGKKKFSGLLGRGTTRKPGKVPRSEIKGTWNSTLPFFWDVEL